MSPTADERLLARIAGATLGGRALLCTLAREGLALRRDDPVRAHLVLHALEPHPLYKGGRLLFDLLELEDLMLDGPPPAPVSRAALRSVTDALADLFRVLARFASELPEAGDARREAAALPSAPDAEEPESDLPELDAAEYLYDLVVLGVLAEASRGMAEASFSGPAGEDGNPGPPSPGSLR